MYKYFLVILSKYGCNASLNNDLNVINVNILGIHNVYSIKYLRYIFIVRRIISVAFLNLENVCV